MSKTPAQMAIPLPKEFVPEQLVAATRRAGELGSTAHIEGVNLESESQ
jgi:hypothetical protein